MTTFYHVDADTDGYPATAAVRCPPVTAPDTGYTHRAYPTLPVRVIPGTESGDYAGSLVERANYAELLDCEPDHDVEPIYAYNSPYRFVSRRSRLIELYSCHGYTGLGWPAWCPLTEDLAEIIAGLETYPIIDEQRLSDVEAEAFDESWPDARRDLARQLTRANPSDTWERAVDSISEEEWYWLLMAAEDGGNPLSQPEGTHVTFDERRIIERIVGLATGATTLRWVEPNDVLTRLTAAWEEST